MTSCTFLLPVRAHTVRCGSLWVAHIRAQCFAQEAVPDDEEPPRLSPRQTGLGAAGGWYGPPSPPAPPSAAAQLHHGQPGDSLEDAPLHRTAAAAAALHVATRPPGSIAQGTAHVGGNPAASLTSPAGEDPFALPLLSVPGLRHSSGTLRSPAGLSFGGIPSPALGPAADSPAFGVPGGAALRQAQPGLPVSPPYDRLGSPALLRVSAGPLPQLPRPRVPVCAPASQDGHSRSD